MSEIRIPAATIRSLWRDKTKTTTELAAIAGISRNALARRAKAFGETARTPGRFKPVIPDTSQFEAMWREGVPVTDIAKHFDVSRSTIYSTAEKLGLPLQRVAA